MRPLAVALAALALVPAPAAKLPPLPHGWRATLQIGLADAPGGASALCRSAAFGFRYQYLAGGVNTGAGWSTWNPDGAFASLYVRDSWAHGVLPVLTYYMLLQSSPAGGAEAATDLAHSRNPQVMQAYWNDVRLLLRRISGATPLVVHVEPDLWGYLEQANDVALASSFAQAWILAYHMSRWGTRHVTERPPDATVRTYAAESAAFYRSLHARFDIAFEDFSDRDAGLYEKQQENPRTWFTPADFHRHLLHGETFVRLSGLRLAAWQIPLGNTLMRAMDDTWGHLPGQPPRGCSARAPTWPSMCARATSGFSSAAARPGRRVRATRTTTESRIPRRSTATPVRRSPPTTTAACFVRLCRPITRRTLRVPR